MICIFLDVILILLKSRFEFHRASKPPSGIETSRGDMSSVVPNNGPFVPYYKNTHMWFGYVKWTQPSDEHARPRAVEDASDTKMVTVHKTGDAISDGLATTLLSRVNARSTVMLDYLKSQYDNGQLSDFPPGSGRSIREPVRRLLERHRGKLSLSEYHNPDPDDMIVAMNVNKGEELSICVRDKGDTTKLNCINTMMRVVLHEFAHTMDHHYRHDSNHGPCFDRLADFLYMTASGIDVTSAAPGGAPSINPLYSCPFSCDKDIGDTAKLIPFCGLMLPRSHCPSDADPSPTSAKCDRDDDVSAPASFTDDWPAIASLEDTAHELIASASAMVQGKTGAFRV
jgi:hypothetical protein